MWKCWNDSADEMKKGNKLDFAKYWQFLLYLTDVKFEF